MIFSIFFKLMKRENLYKFRFSPTSKQQYELVGEGNILIFSYKDQL